jgi:hypothetical protein
VLRDRGSRKGRDRTPHPLKYMKETAMLKTSWRFVTQAGRKEFYPRVVRPSGWKGAYNRKPPTGYHKCLTRTEMDKVIRSMG